ncbi:hypothetical protein SCLCIDRAFT_940626 [Scleroderma citrinum Foug A]|uniref:Uncharacterized protein n=1 Tax=Scleroderma citrinum Foug A TaxID=1036808 RepID=A0A0C3A6N4_9AGAM|nr:hypothetical protein SCLCIDRAFT_940626 [Scleroderma citrinum Foug A]
MHYNVWILVSIQIFKVDSGLSICNISIRLLAQSVHRYVRSVMHCYKVTINHYYAFQWNNYLRLLGDQYPSVQSLSIDKYSLHSNLRLEH